METLISSNNCSLHNDSFGCWSRVGIWKIIATLSPQISAAIIAAAATVMVSGFTILLTKKNERLKEIEQEQRKQKVPVYEEFVAFVFKIPLAEKLGEKPVSEKEMMKFVSNFAQKIIVWGSDDVIKACANFRRFAGKGSAGEFMLIVEQLLFAIRADVGYKNKNLQRGDLLSIFINDVDTILVELNSRKEIAEK